MSATNVEPPHAAVVEAVSRALAEDLTPLGDITSALLPADLWTTATFTAREDGVLAGVECVEETFRQLDPRVTVSWDVRDGDELFAGKPVGVVHGPLASLLTGERTALNFLSHLSGVATATREFVAVAAGRVTVWDTRKTTPGLRMLEKAAVRAGGGANHRGNLSDWVLLKDNHLAHLGITEAVDRARRTWPARTVHVECDSVDQVVEAVRAGADALLLDNMDAETIRSCVALADKQAADAGRRRPLLEASGEVTIERLDELADTGIDCISIGRITKSAPALDIGLDIATDSAGE